MRLSLNKLGIVLGLFFGVAYAASLFICWHLGVTPYVYYQRFATWIPLILGTLILLGWNWRKRNGDNPLAFLQGLQYAFIAYILFEVITLLSNIVLHNFLDTSLYDKGVLFSLNDQLVYNQTHGGSADKINEIQSSIDYTKAHPTKGMPAIQLLLGFGQSIIGSFFKSMLVGFIIQKKDVNASISRGNA
jgi:hypothetical protein